MMAYEDYVGKTDIREDTLDARLVRGLAATPGRPVPAARPPLWRWRSLTRP